MLGGAVVAIPLFLWAVRGAVLASFAVGVSYLYSYLYSFFVSSLLSSLLSFYVLSMYHSLSVLFPPLSRLSYLLV